MENSTGKGVTVDVEYCSGWGYGSKYEKLRKDILAAFPSAEVNGVKGRLTSFEIKINSKELYSKLERGAFPIYASVVKAVERASRGLEPEPIEADSSSSCVLS